jgi:DNA-binding response OmpR family regulator
VALPPTGRKSTTENVDNEERLLKKILLVDDDGDFRSILREVLSEEGFSTVEAADGLEAIRLFLDDPPDAVLLDHHMYPTSGLVTLMNMRRLNSRTPVIMISATQDSAISGVANMFGVCEFMAKPLDFGELVLKVRKYVERD